MSQWDTVKKDGIVSLDEFRQYYADLSASVDRDDYFVLMVQRAWQLEPERGDPDAFRPQLRVLVTHADGHKSVEAVPQDAFLKRGDTRGLIERLQRRGIEAKEVSLDF